ncbi:tetratricopeptide repeat protein [Aquihabitans sp. G128]|uniref:tetratricopeptide repeat protein n=1 Tax=Aquihabitans sp. G128 TaxID=2849779 RepID=UPI001C229D2B|nr:tetratricopeptide repeat protein [Aquihabitans sp. G128]QXC61540.1 tetratricopeptide repeat protein [Aquihabitans sp. G128]
MVDVTDATFEQEILERSDSVPVVVDLWAPWCGPCRTLGPIIEKVVDEADGDVVLVKVNTDENPGLTQAFQVQGIPAVHAVYQRKVVNSFVGAQPEAKVREFIDSLRPSEQQREIQALLDAGDEASLLQVLELDPGHPVAVVGLAELYVADERPEDALAMLAKVPESAETRRVAALARTGAPEATDEDGAPVLLDVEDKLNDLLTRVKGDDDARQEYLDLLELMGPTDPRTVEFRRALSKQLF